VHSHFTVGTPLPLSFGCNSLAVVAKPVFVFLVKPELPMEGALRNASIKLSGFIVVMKSPSEHSVENTSWIQKRGKVCSCLFARH
jgi:hypothetical protein